MSRIPALVLGPALIAALGGCASPRLSSTPSARDPSVATASTAVPDAYLAALPGQEPPPVPPPPPAPPAPPPAEKPGGETPPAAPEPTPPTEPGKEAPSAKDKPADPPAAKAEGE